VEKQVLAIITQTFAVGNCSVIWPIAFSIIPVYVAYWKIPHLEI